MRCDEVISLIPGMVDGEASANVAVERHLQTCLRCQAEMARYRRLLRTLAMLRTRYVAVLYAGGFCFSSASMRSFCCWRL